MPSVLLIDFKFNGSTHVLEFGCGLNSSYTGYAFIHQNDGPIMYRRVLEKLGEKYKNVAVLCKSPMASMQLNELVGEMKESKAHFTSLNCGVYMGMGHSSFQDPDKLSSAKQDQLKKHTKEDCIVVVESDSYECMLFAKKLAKYLKQEGVTTNVANSNDSIAALAKNKVCCSYFGAKKYIKTELISMKEMDAKKIESVCTGSEKVVIKPSNSSGGEGVIVTTPDRLPLYFELIKFRHQFGKNWLGSYGDTDNYQKCLDKCKELGIDQKTEGKAIDFWIHNYNDFFLLQEFKASTPVDDYDATGRLVFIVNDDLTIDFIDGYWKLPPYHLSEKIPGSMTYVSDVHPDHEQHRPPSLPIDRDMLKRIKETAAPIILDVVGKALQSSLKAHMIEMKSSPDKELRQYSETTLKEQFEDILDVDKPLIRDTTERVIVTPTTEILDAPKASVVPHGIFSHSINDLEGSKQPLLPKVENEKQACCSCVIL